MTTLNQSQISLFEPEVMATLTSDEETNNDWETPEAEARLFVRIINDHLMPSPWQASGSFRPRVLEVGAGNGAITRHCPDTWNVTAIEVKKSRCNAGAIAAPHAHWINGAVQPGFSIGTSYDVIFSNPPFGKDAFVPFFEGAIEAMKFTGFVALIIPTTFWQTVWGADVLKRSGLVIVKQYSFLNRIAFLKGGVAQSNRQCYDMICILSSIGTAAVEIIDPKGAA